MSKEQNINFSASDDSWSINSSGESFDAMLKPRSISTSCEDIVSSDCYMGDDPRLEWNPLGQSLSHHKVLDKFRLDVENEVIEDAHCGPSLTKRAFAEPVISEHWNKESAEWNSVEVTASVQANAGRSCSPARPCIAASAAHPRPEVSLVMPILHIPLVPLGRASSPAPIPLQDTTIASPCGGAVELVEREKPAKVRDALQNPGLDTDNSLSSSYDIFRMDLDDSVTDCENKSMTPLQVLSRYPQPSLESTLFSSPSLCSLAPRLVLTPTSMRPHSLPASSSLSSEEPSLQGTPSNGLVVSSARADGDARGRLDRKYKEIMGIMAGLQELMSTKAKLEERDRSVQPEPSVEAAVALCKANEVMSVVQPRSLRGRARSISRWSVRARLLLYVAWGAWFTLLLQAVGLLDMLGVDSAAIQVLPLIEFTEILSMLEVLGLLEVLWLLNGMPIVSGAFGRPECYVDAATNTEHLPP